MPIHSQSPAEPPFLPGHSSTANILVAEDPFVSSFLRTILQRHGHKVVVVGAPHASELLRQGTVVADVVVTNQPELFLGFAGRVHLLYTAAAPDATLASQFASCRVLRKPFRNEDLLEAVDALTHALS